MANGYIAVPGRIEHGVLEQRAAARAPVELFCIYFISFLTDTASRAAIGGGSGFGKEMLGRACRPGTEP